METFSREGGPLYFFGKKLLVKILILIIKSIRRNIPFNNMELTGKPFITIVGE